ncbi:hypothetical protein Pcinc_009263 [Petrolisthes cinctipes]|uniref:PiggyBac transposable element-derived protein domain-containing protein n=1 Tax=Petrolisthes cinctipes TaxID=88211 RepID=A0AAE1G790_PETCI|nr:hypothetical protein Pcinc_009263 [Petrolisthes cinctipes]
MALNPRKPLTTKELEDILNSSVFSKDNDSINNYEIDTVTVCGTNSESHSPAKSPSPPLEVSVSRGSSPLSDTFIECTANPDGSVVAVVTPNKEIPSTSQLPVSSKRRLFTSTPVAKRRRIIMSDSPSDDPDDPEYKAADDSSDDSSDSSDGGAPPSQASTAPPSQASTAPPSQASTAPPSQASTAPPSEASTASPSQTSPPTQDSSGPTATPSTSAKHLFQLSPGQCRPSDKTVWSRTPITTHRSTTQNTQTYRKGLTAKSHNAESFLDFFKLIVDEDMVQSIVTHTNIRIDILAPKFRNQPHASVNHTCPEEIWALIGILIISGAKQDNKKTLADMFSIMHGPLIYRAGMSENRFKFLLRALRFDEHDTREERMSRDRLAPFRNIWEKFIKNCKEGYIPGSDITVDEQMLGFRGRCPFRYYMSKKPQKYGLKIIIACDAKEYYMLNGIVDLGKQRTEKVAPGKIGEYYTMKLVEPYLDCGRTITTDNWFTSMSLANELHKRQTTLVGTLRRKGYVPNAMINLKIERPLQSSIFLYKENLTMLSYKPKRHKIVLMISSKHNTPEIAENKKPKMIHYYNEMKGGVDVLDNMCARYSCSRKTQRWPLCLFYGMPNIAVTNAFILCRMKRGIKIRRLFMQTLAGELVRPWAEMRLQQRGMKSSVKFIIKSCFNITCDRPPNETIAAGPHTKRRCKICPYKKAKQTRTVYSYYDKPVCPVHSHVTCNECED